MIDVLADALFDAVRPVVLGRLVALGVVGPQLEPKAPQAFWPRGDPKQDDEAYVESIAVDPHGLDRGVGRSDRLQLASHRTRGCEHTRFVFDLRDPG